LRATYASAETVTENDLTSKALVLPRVAAGDADAMRLCLSQFGGIVWSIVRRHLKNQSEAEDLVQEVFIEIWKKAASFDPALASEATFVGLIARRRSIDYLRRQGRKPDFEPLSAAESVPLPALEKSSVLCDPETVKSSLASFPADTRQLFELFFEGGFTHPEIAARTGLPLGTVKTRLRRGLIALREQLQRIATPNQTPAS
jgi:RNA polymerase sigma-70 factor (ECF subfamily)